MHGDGCKHQVSRVEFVTYRRQRYKGEVTGVKTTWQQLSSQTEGRIKAYIWNIYRLQDTGAEEEEEEEEE